ncbi:uncharacterized protein TNCV_3076631 [Trichonephila clavipes]|nr:uncharacterized protein TNCV_3076631 [Trichonephila clavipes]
MFKIVYEPEEWRLFIDSSKRCLKAVLLHNGNRYASVPVGHSVHLKECYENLEFILNKLNYSDHKWTICDSFEWAQNEIAVVPDFHKRILFSDEAHFWLNGYVNKQSCRIWSEANPQVYVEIPLHPEKLTVWCALWAGGILLQKQ